MLELLIVLGGVYLLYMAGMKNMLRYRLFGKEVHEYISYASFLALGGLISITIALPIQRMATDRIDVHSLEIATTVLAIAIGEVCYRRNDKWTVRFVDRTLKSVERQSRTKRM